MRDTRTMEPNKKQWNVVQLSEYKAKKYSPFGPIQRGIVTPKDEEFRKHADEAIALGNSWRDKDK